MKIVSQVALHDRAIEVGVQEVEARRGAPVPEQARLDVLRLKRSSRNSGLSQQVDLADRQVVGRPPPHVHPAKLVFRQRACGKSAALSLLVRSRLLDWLLCRP